MQIIQLQNNTIFKGNIYITTNISKKAKNTHKFLAEVLNEKYNGKSFREVIKTMPFNAYISCKNSTKKAINPCLSIFLEKKESKNSIGMYSITHLKFNKSNEIERLHNIACNFAQACEENKNKPPFNKREANTHIAEQILKGFFNKK